MLQPLWPCSTQTKFIDFRQVINFLERSAFWDFAIFFASKFDFFAYCKVHAFISQKLNEGGWTFLACW